MTKAEQIRALDDGTRTTKEIAEAVGCLPSYVRVVTRQRVGGVSPSDIKYRAKVAAESGCATYGKLRYLRRGPMLLASSNARYRALRAGHDLDTANAIGRLAYRNERKRTRRADPATGRPGDESGSVSSAAE